MLDDRPAEGLPLPGVADGDVDAWNPLAGEIAPDPASADVYGRQFAVFKELYPRTKDLMAGLL